MDNTSSQLSQYNLSNLSPYQKGLLTMAMLSGSHPNNKNFQDGFVKMLTDPQMIANQNIQNIMGQDGSQGQTNTSNSTNPAINSTPAVASTPSPDAGAVSAQPQQDPNRDQGINGIWGLGGIWNLGTALARGGASALSNTVGDIVPATISAGNLVTGQGFQPSTNGSILSNSNGIHPQMVAPWDAFGDAVKSPNTDYLKSVGFQNPVVKGAAEFGADLIANPLNKINVVGGIGKGINAIKNLGKAGEVAQGAGEIANTAAKDAYTGAKQVGDTMVGGVYKDPLMQSAEDIAANATMKQTAQTGAAAKYVTPFLQKMGGIPTMWGGEAVDVPKIAQKLLNYVGIEGSPEVLGQKVADRFSALDGVAQNAAPKVLTTSPTDEALNTLNNFLTKTDLPQKTSDTVLQNVQQLIKDAGNDGSKWLQLPTQINQIADGITHEGSQKVIYNLAKEIGKVGDAAIDASGGMQMTPELMNKISQAYPGISDSQVFLRDLGNIKGSADYRAMMQPLVLGKQMASNAAKTAINKTGLPKFTGNPFNPMDSIPALIGALTKNKVTDAASEFLQKRALQKDVAGQMAGGAPMTAADGGIINGAKNVIGGIADGVQNGASAVAGSAPAQGIANAANQIERRLPGSTGAYGVGISQALSGSYPQGGNQDQNNSGGNGSTNYQNLVPGNPALSRSIQSFKNTEQAIVDNYADHQTLKNALVRQYGVDPAKAEALADSKYKLGSANIIKTTAGILRSSSALQQIGQNWEKVSNTGPGIGFLTENTSNLNPDLRAYQSSLGYAKDIALGLGNGGGGKYSTEEIKKMLPDTGDTKEQGRAKLSRLAEVLHENLIKVINTGGMGAGADGNAVTGNPGQ